VLFHRLQRDSVYPILFRLRRHTLRYYKSIAVVVLRCLGLLLALRLWLGQWGVQQQQGAPPLSEVRSITCTYFTDSNVYDTQSVLARLINGRAHFKMSYVYSSWWFEVPGFAAGTAAVARVMGHATAAGSTTIVGGTVEFLCQ
jgi:hypothetical protein